MNNSSLDESIIRSLRKKRRKATPQRIAICRFVLSSREHPTVQNIYIKVKETHPTVSLATVYKTLKILKELGLIQELAFTQGETRLDSYMEPHVNLVCQRCGNISDVDDRAVRSMIARVITKAKFNMIGERFDIYGVCERCSKRKIL